MGNAHCLCFFPWWNNCEPSTKVNCHVKQTNRSLFESTEPHCCRALNGKWTWFMSLNFTFHKNFTLQGDEIFGYLINALPPPRMQIFTILNPSIFIRNLKQQQQSEDSPLKTHLKFCGWLESANPWTILHYWVGSRRLRDQAAPEIVL